MYVHAKYHCVVSAIARRKIFTPCKSIGNESGSICITADFMPLPLAIDYRVEGKGWETEGAILTFCT